MQPNRTTLEFPETEPDVAPEPARPARWLDARKARLIALWVTGVMCAGLLAFGFVYLRFARLIDQRLSAGAFSDTTSIYTRPHTIAVGDALREPDVVARLRRSGYSASQGNAIGWYEARPSALAVFPGANSYSGGDAAALTFADGKVVRIASPDGRLDRQTYALEPELMTNLSGQREKRHLVRFGEIPGTLVQAVISAEDKHFFHHSGFDFLRIVKAAYLDLKDGRKEQGASTLTMQLARGFWLEPEKRWKRKIEELFITMHLEDRLTKQQIFEDYANEVYLGRNGTFSISGFGEAARVYFNKDISQLNVPEAALLAGLVQRPSYFNPARYPDRARERRNLVLSLMLQNGYLTQQQYAQATASPVVVAPEKSESFASHYFIDLMNDEMQNKLDDPQEHTRYIYSTIDPDLQQAAQDAVDIGMKQVDQRLGKGNKHSTLPADQPQVALVALDPRTGEVRALVGGRNYGASQLNHALAKRQPGSVFKPFVYAAAMDSGLSGGRQVFTPATIMSDEPTSFTFNHAAYQPNNFHHEFMGDVTLRTALIHSLNVVAVELAQQVGYEQVVALARRAGIRGAQPTPSVALGSYEATPLEIAGAYTMFANHGVRVTPTTIALARSPDGTVVYQHSPDQRAVLDPRVDYLMVNMMQDVLRSGTGAAVRSMGFTAPAAGKTGTSRDGWFAGFTSELLCVVWVGFDDNRELNLEGAKSALPIWAEFMKRATVMREYHDAKAFQPPPGIVSLNICPESGMRAGDNCPEARWEVFINGTQPSAMCDLHGYGAYASAGH